MTSATLLNTLKDLGIPGAVGSLFGVALGWYLNRRSATEALVIQQRREAAANLLDAVVEARINTRVMIEKSEVGRGLEVARKELRRAVLRYTGRIGNSEITSRVDALPLMLFIATEGGRADPQSKGGDSTTDLFSLAYIVERAFTDAFICLDAYLNNEPLPPRTFPDNAMEVMSDDSRSGDPVGRLRLELNNWPTADNTARTKIFSDL